MGIIDLLKKAETYRMIKFCYPNDKIRHIAIVNIQSPIDEHIIIASIFVDKIKSDAEKLMRLRSSIINSDNCNNILNHLKEQIDEYESLIE